MKVLIVVSILLFVSGGAIVILSEGEVQESPDSTTLPMNCDYDSIGQGWEFSDTQPTWGPTIKPSIEIVTEGLLILLNEYEKECKKDTTYLTLPGKYYFVIGENIKNGIGPYYILPLSQQPNFQGFIKFLQNKVKGETP